MKPALITLLILDLILIYCCGYIIGYFGLI
jgi:hypothetical protein